MKLSHPVKDMAVHDPIIVPKHPQSNGLVVFKTSERWFLDERPQKEVRAVPFIDRNGLIHATTVCQWKCSSYQLYATIVGTVYKRLSHLVHTVNKKKHRVVDDNLLLKIALHYSATNDDSWFKRCLAMIFHRAKGLLNFVYRTIKSVDANKGFLYDQALNNASWFKRHSKLPWKCDKSTSNDWKDKYLKHHVPPLAMHYCGGIVRCLSYELSSVWSRVYHVPIHKISVYSAGHPLFRG